MDHHEHLIKQGKGIVARSANHSSDMMIGEMNWAQRISIPAHPVVIGTWARRFAQAVSIVGACPDAELGPERRFSLIPWLQRSDEPSTLVLF